MSVIPKVGEVFRGEDGVISVVLPDACDPDHEPTEEELYEYAEYLGINPEEEKHLLWIAREGLKTPLPEEWKTCQTGDEEPYYFNFCTGESSWEHPLDDMFKQKVEVERAKTNASRLVSGTNYGDSKALMGSTSLTYSSASSSVSSDGTDSSVEVSVNRTRMLGDVRMEKGSGGNARPVSEVRAPLHTGPLPFACETMSVSFSGEGLDESSQVNQTVGKLGVLRAPGLAQRSKVDVSSLLETGKSKSSSLSISGAKGNFTALSKAKFHEGARDMESLIRQRIDEENEAKRRNMRLQHEKQLADERIRLEVEIRKVIADCDKEFKEEQQRIKASAGKLQKSNESIGGSTLQREYDEVRKQVTALSVLLQREEVKLASETQRRIADLKERINNSNESKLAKVKEDALVKLEGEKEKHTTIYRQQLEEESKKLAACTQVAVAALKKVLEEKRAVIEEQLGRKMPKYPPAIHTAFSVDTHPLVLEAQLSLEASLRKATVEAEAASAALRHRYDKEIEELTLEKQQALSEINDTNTTVVHLAKSTMESSSAPNTLGREEEELKRALEEKTTRYRDETEQLLLFMQREAAGSKTTSLNTTVSGGVALPSDVECAEEQQGYDKAWKQLDEKHARAMDRIRSAHEQLLRDRHLFDPRKSMDFSGKLRARQRKWLEAHPKPKLVEPEIQTVEQSGNHSRGAGPHISEHLAEEKVNSAVKKAVEEAQRKHAEQLQTLGDLLQADNRVACEAHRARMNEDMQARIKQYLEVCLIKYWKTTDSAAPTSEGVLGSVSGAHVGHLEGSVQPVPQSHEAVVSLEEANRREEEVHRLWQERIKVLEEAARRSQAEVRRQQDLLHSKFLFSGQRPPTVPAVSSPLVPNDVFYTPRFPLQCKPVQSTFTTPVLNNTWSTIHSMCTANGSEKQGVTKCSYPSDVCFGLQRNPVVKNQGDDELDSEHVLRNGAQGDCLYDLNHGLGSCFQHARLMLLGKKDELLKRRARIERSRASWLRDMEECRKTGNKDHVRLLRQIKDSLEEKARDLNRMIFELRLAFASLRERERSSRDAVNRNGPAGAGGAATFLNSCEISSDPVHSAGVNVTKQSQYLVGLLDGMLTKTAKLESFITPLRGRDKVTNNKDIKAKHRHDSGKQLRPAARRGSATPSADGMSGGVNQWLDEQQLIS